MIRINTQSTGFRRDFNTLLSRTRNPVGMLKVAGRELSNLLKRHFRQKDRSDVNRLAPGRRQHLWLQIGQSVQNPEQTGLNSISVAINHPLIASKVFGGVITAKRVRALSIPQSPDAYGRTPATFEHETGRRLVLLRQNNNLLLASRLSPTASRLQVEYLLTPSVTQPPDPTALPSKREMETAVLNRSEKFLSNEAASGGSTNS